MRFISIEVNVEQGGVRWHGQGWWEMPPFGSASEMLCVPITIAVAKGLAKRIDMGKLFDYKMTGDAWTLEGKPAEDAARWEKGKSLDGEDRIHWERVAVETWAICEGN